MAPVEGGLQVEARWCREPRHFERVSEFLAASTHPGLPCVVAQGCVPGLEPGLEPHPYRLTKVVEGSSLLDWRPGPWAESVALWRQAMLVLIALERLELPDLTFPRPSVVRTPAGQLRFTEIGVRHPDDFMSGVSTTMDPLLLTQDHLASRCGPLTNQLVAGGLGYFLLTGQCLGGDDGNIFGLLNPTVEPRTHVPDLPEAVEAVLVKMLAADPAQRFPSLKAAVEGIPA